MSWKCPNCRTENADFIIEGVRKTQCLCGYNLQSGEADFDIKQKSGQLPKPGPLFLYIPIQRLVLLSIASCGLYEAYWIYKNWQYIKERDGLNIRPFWRGVFAIFYCNSLFKRIHTDSDARSVIAPSFSPSGLAMGFIMFAIIGNAISRVPGAVASIIAFVMPSYLFLVPVQNYINSATQRKDSNQPYYGWSSGHVVCLVLGLIFWVLTIWALGDESL